MRTIVSSRIAGEGLLKNVTSLPSYPPTLRTSKRAAFTLAEVLITLAIVGVVAAITLPPLITNIQSQVKAKRVQNIKQKFSKATDKMLAMSGMNGYGSTENFVEELKHHLKIAKVCDNDHLAECWGYEKVKLNKNGITFKISDIKNGSDLKMTEKSGDWDDTVGIVTADGTPIIFSYNKKCNIDENIHPIWNENQSSSASCVAAIFDWNGSKGPNMYFTLLNGNNSDVISFNSNGIGSECALIKGENTCFSLPKPATAISKEECNSIKDKYDIMCGGVVNDYWAGAVKECDGRSNMPSSTDLAKIATMIYGTEIDTSEVSYGLYNSNIASSLGFPASASTPFIVWSKNQYHANNSYSRRFMPSSTTYNHFWLRSVPGYVMCTKN